MMMSSQLNILSREDSIELDRIDNTTIIKTISYDQEEIIKWIYKLYCPNGFDLDPTYSKGVFYKNLTEPKIKMDLYPKTIDTIQADFTQLPLKDNSVDSIMFDPPFVGGTPKTRSGGIIKKRFGCYKNMDEVFASYEKAIWEAKRVLTTGGIYVFKCQDTILSGKQHMSHVEIINMAEGCGFYTKDLFILLAKNRIIGKHHHTQYHARKFHSYFIVFEYESKWLRRRGKEDELDTTTIK